MRTIARLLFFIPFFFTLSFNEKKTSYDICVYGGTSAGVIAAYTAAQMGKKVVLIEPGKHLGGLTAGGLGYTDIGNKYAISGLSRAFYRKIGKHYGKFEQWTFEPHVAENLFKQYINHPNISVLFEHQIIKATKASKVIQEIELKHHSGSRSSAKTVAAAIFLDCSYEGDLMAMAGVSYIVGRESNATYQEKYNGVQLMDGHQFPDGIDPYKVRGDVSSGLLWGIDTATLQPNGTGDKKVQAYNYRICLTNDPVNRREIDRPGNYDSSRYELLLRLFEAQPAKRKLNDYFIVSQMPDRKTDINNRGGFSSDMIGMNHRYPEADYEERKKIINTLEDYTKGLLYFIGHDSRVPEHLREEMQAWGYPKDEFTDNNNWSHQPYIRESRRMIGAYVMTQHNCEGRENITDTIGLAAYTMDSHNCQRLVVNGMVKNEGNVEVGGFGPYPIAYRSIIPKTGECTNLYVPVCLSASHIAYGSIRMEPVFMVLAQSAAVAACLAIDNKQTVQEVNVKKLQLLLKQDPLLDGSTPEVLVDNDNRDRVRIQGAWKRMTSEPALGYGGNYGPSMLVAETGGGENSQVTFTPSIAVAGLYKLYYYVPKIRNLAKAFLVTVNAGKVIKEVRIETESIVVEGQTSGEWVYLGTYTFPKGNGSFVSVSDKGAGGALVADAVLFVPEK